MTVTGQDIYSYVRYKGIGKQKAREYYAKNKEKIKESQREKYKILSSEMKKILFENKNNGLIDNLKRNKMRWEEKQESIQKTDIIIIWLLLIKVAMCFFAIWFTWIYCKIIKICFNLKMENLRSKCGVPERPKAHYSVSVSASKLLSYLEMRIIFFCFFKAVNYFGKMSLS